MDSEYGSAPQDKDQPNPPPYRDVSQMGHPQPDSVQQPYPGLQPYSGQVYPAPGQTVIAVQPQMSLSPPENDYLGYSIFTLLCCCLPLGIAALICSMSAREANSRGDRAEAARSSRHARILNHMALGIGLVVIIIFIIYMIVIVTKINNMN